jgi:exopolysaccharide production protein ExoQ
MSQTSMHRLASVQPKTSTRTIDKYSIVPLAACVTSLIVLPLFLYFNPTTDEAIANGVSRQENKIFWPIMAAISVILAVQNHHRLTKLSWAPNIICLLAYLAFAGVSALWAFRPEISFTRFALEVMVVISIVLPAMLASRTCDLMHGLFLCFALASLLNIYFVIDGTRTIVLNAGAHGLYRDDLGSPGYFTFKNYLGECAAVAFLLSIYEILYPGWRRMLGIIGAVISSYLIFSSHSKTALGLALLCPFVSLITLLVKKATSISPAIILLFIPLCFIVLSTASGHYNLNLLSYKLYGDSTFTGRTIIWDFVQREIDLRPLLGWGYESFWLVPGSPALEAPGWIKGMPNGHNGYYDTMLDLGYVGFALLLAFIIATLHGIGRVSDRDPTRGWIVLSLVLYVILYNFLERLWMHGFEFLWVVFVIVAAEIGRYWLPFPITRVVRGSRGPRPRRNSGPPLAAQTPRLSTMMRHHD